MRDGVNSSERVSLESCWRGEEAGRRERVKEEEEKEEIHKLPENRTQ